MAQKPKIVNRSTRERVSMLHLPRCIVLLSACLIGSAVMLDAVPVRGEVKEVRIGIQYGLSCLPITLAQAQGYYAKQARKAGLDTLNAQIIYTSGTPAVTDALVSDSIDIGSYGPPGLLIIWDKTRGRQDVRALAGVSAYAFSLFTNKPQIKSLGDFGEQDRIAVASPASPQAFLMRMAAEKFFGPGQHGRLDTLMVSMPHPDAMVALVAGRTISGYMASPPFIAALRDSGKVHEVISTRDILGGEEPSAIILAASRNFVETNPTVARVVIAAVRDAIDFIAREPERAAEIYLKTESAKISKQEVMSMLTDGSMLYSVAPSGVLIYARFMARTGGIKRSPETWRDVFFPILGDERGN
jgi:NitT/TauT family transport system substrate-binding protein